MSQQYFTSSSLLAFKLLGFTGELCSSLCFLFPSSSQSHQRQTEWETRRGLLYVLSVQVYARLCAALCRWTEDVTGKSTWPCIGSTKDCVCVHPIMHVCSETILFVLCAVVGKCHFSFCLGMFWIWSVTWIYSKSYLHADLIMEVVAKQLHALPSLWLNKEKQAFRFKKRMSSEKVLSPYFTISSWKADWTGIYHIFAETHTCT